MSNEAQANGGDISFLPTSWHDIQPGDRIVSKSGTVRTVIEINEARGRLSVAFRTTRKNGDVELETAHVDPRSVRGIKEVLRRDPEATKGPPPPLHLPMGISKRFTPLAWSDLKPGDVVISHSGSRRLVVADVTNEGGEPEFDCFYRNNAGVIERSFLHTAPNTIEGIKEILRQTVRIPLDNERLSLTDGLIENVDALLGRGDRGDQFTQALFSGADLSLTTSQCVKICGEVDLRSGEITDFFNFDPADPTHPPVLFEIFMPAEYDKPISISEVYFHPHFQLHSAEDILLAATLSNTLKGVAPRQS